MNYDFIDTLMLFIITIGCIIDLGFIFYDHRKELRRFIKRSIRRIKPVKRRRKPKLKIIDGEAINE